MSKSHYVLGISMSRHDRAACLLKNGIVVGAIAEERLDRRKRSIGTYRFSGRGIVLPPLAAITYVLRKEAIGLNDVNLVVCGRSMRQCRDTVLEYLPVSPELVVEVPMPGHHLAHAYSAYGTSPFARSAVLVIDEQGHHVDGQFEKCSWFEGSTGPLTLLGRFMGDDGDDLSLGMFYNAFASMTSLTDGPYPGVGKLMGLAAFGKQRPEWPELISLDPASDDTHISVHQMDEFFDLVGLQIRPGTADFPARRLEDLGKYAPVEWSSDLAADLARKAQEELERAVLHICAALRRRSSTETLSYAGGVALNCTANRRLREAGWADVYIHPAATDDGNAVGLAVYGWVEVLGNPRQPAKMFSPFTGRRYSRDEVGEAISVFGLKEFAHEVSATEEGAARAARGETICWFQGESEWGPRALGARSIVASPLIPGIRNRINSTIKYREGFRPFAISGTFEGLDSLVEIASLSASLAPYMLTAGKVKDARLSEVRHVDGTVRYQAVVADLQPIWYQLIEAFGRLTGVYAILNTSFNTLSEPLVETPMDAVRQFLISGADALILESVLLARSEIPEQAKSDACALAWSLTPIDPLSAAFRLAAAGYVEVALDLLEQTQYTVETARQEGPDAFLRYHSLRQHAALQRGDLDAARDHAETILQSSGLPPETLHAARYLAEDLDGDQRRRLAGQLVNSIGQPGGAFSFFKTMLGTEEQSA